MLSVAAPDLMLAFQNGLAKTFISLHIQGTQEVVPEHF